MERQSPDLAAAADWVNRIVDDELTRSTRWHGDTFTNMAYASGNQWVQFDKDTGVVLPIALEDDWAVRITFNRIRDIMERVTAQVLRNRPQWIALPGSSSMTSRLAAKGWQSYFDWLWDHHLLRRILRDEAIPWALVSGRGILRVIWNPDVGATWRVRYPQAPNPKKADQQAAAAEMQALSAPQGAQPGMPPPPPRGFSLIDGGMPPSQPPEKVEEGPLGELEFGCVSPFNFVKDPTATSIRKAAWAGECMFVRRQDAEEAFPGETFSPDSEEEASPRFSRQIMSGLHRFGVLLADALTGRRGAGKYVKGVGLYDSEGLGDLVLVKEIYVRPSKQHKQGRHLVVINDRCVKSGPNPYGKDLPYVTFEFAPVLGSGESDSLISQLRPAQSAINMRASRMLERDNLWNNPRLLLPLSCGVDLEDVNDKPGGVVRYKPGTRGEKPEIMNPPMPDIQADRQIQFYISQMEDISGIRKVSQGINPEGVRSARALVHLKEADEEGRATFQERVEDSLTDMARISARITRKYQIEDRTLGVVGRDGRASVVEFLRSDVDRDMDVLVICDNGWPKSLGGKVQAITSLLELGIFDLADPRIRKNVQLALATGGLQALLENFNGPEDERIHIENMMLLQGQEVEVLPQDLQEDHLEDHREMMRSPVYFDAVRANPRVRDAFQAHTDLHIVAIQGTGSPAMGLPIPGVGGAGQDQGSAPPPAFGNGPGAPMLPAASGGPMAAGMSGA